MNTRTEAVTHQRSSTGALRAFSILNGLALLGVLLQGLSAGGFLGHVGGADWLGLHQITAPVVMICSLAAAVVAVAALRHHSGIAWWSAALFVLLVIQSALGAASSESGQRALLAVHIPLAMLIMGLGVYLSIAGARARRSAPLRP